MADFVDDETVTPAGNRTKGPDLLSLIKGSVPDCVRIRPPLYHPDFPYVLFWSQKSGCTTVVKWFFAQIGELEKALEYSAWVHRYEGEVYKARPGYRKEVHAALKSGRYKAVKVVRDPWRRAPSAFLVLAERGAVVAKHHWVKEHWTLVDAWLAKRGLDPSAGISFLDHLAMVRELQANDPKSLNAHLAPQFVPGESDFVQEVVPIERFQAWAEAAAARPGVRGIDFSRVAESKHHHTTDAAVTEALGPTPEATPIPRGAYRDGRFPSGSAFINERSRAAIRQTYAEDFAAYGSHYES